MLIKYRVDVGTTVSAIQNKHVKMVLIVVDRIVVVMTIILCQMHDFKNCELTFMT